jgi:enoyl-CoA hydratase
MELTHLGNRLGRSSSLFCRLSRPLSLQGCRTRRRRSFLVHFQKVDPSFRFLVVLLQFLDLLNQPSPRRPQLIREASLHDCAISMPEQTRGMPLVDFRHGWLRASRYRRPGFPADHQSADHADSGSEPLTVSSPFSLQKQEGLYLLRVQSPDRTNRLTREGVIALAATLEGIAAERRPVVLTGNDRFFSAGAELTEVAALTGPAAYEFAKMGRALMDAIDCFPAPVWAAISGYCMGGGLDLALACHRRIGSPHAVFGHRGAALGLITGWGGTQRLPRLVGKAIALEILLAAEKMGAQQALRVGLIDAIANDPVAEAVRRIGR